MRYQFEAMPSTVAHWHRKNRLDKLGNRILHVHDGGTYPCRHCLKEAGKKDGALLFSYRLPLPDSVYAQPTAVFLCKGECTGYTGGQSVPEIVGNRFVALRAFRAKGLMDYAMNTLSDGKGVGDEVERILQNNEIAFINVHTALAGCMLCAVRRT
ncbi:DUF1203 domain-containing protein [Roseobacter denitrificans]|uniref:DUF1203 domain-containing protein n=1 Tax=Roseobacter denitrificans (strain ATCC 33942 / OCh 114) TaxID=375451 RepID=Q166P0_ROSDO|nr:DUF1203 domain-containing protein [Roseobacter denitrificans]ABG32053.1 conserved hypothetical protein [Roseobacter denitrificans OCh 114]AVL51576.1 DUF1203 domain-containing protein [Roseobacter denitrificans]SFF76698.1 Protein of unknown function [Roseobacter denitrificans OCh 114]